MARKIGLVMAMEEEMMQAEDSAAIVDNEGSAETAMLEATDMDSEIEDQIDDTEVVAGSTDELSNIADVMEKTTETGGMDEQTAEVVEVAIEGIYARMGVKRHAKMPAMESFANKTSKLQATRIAIEDARSFIATAWKKIIEAISNATEFILNLLKKIFDVNLRMKDRAAAYKGKLATLKNKQVKEPQIKTGSFGKALALEESSQGFAANVITGITRLVAATDKNTGLAEKIVAGAKRMSDADNRSLLIELPMGSEVGKSDGFDEQASGISISRSEMLPGGKAFISKYPKGNESEGNVYNGEITAGVSDFNPRKPLEFNPEKVNTASVDQMEKIVEAVQALSQAVTKNKAECEKLTSTRKELLATVKALFSKSAEEKSETVKKQQKFAMTFNRLSKAFMTDFNKYSVSSGMAALNYVQKSMEQFDPKSTGIDKETEGKSLTNDPIDSKEPLRIQK